MAGDGVAGMAVKVEVEAHGAETMAAGRILHDVERDAVRGMRLPVELMLEVVEELRAERSRGEK